jgi:hypothetical protein
MEMKVITIPGRVSRKVSRLVEAQKRDKNNEYVQNLIVRSLRKPKDVEVTAFMMFDFVCQKCVKIPKKWSIRRIKSCRT